MEQHHHGKIIFISATLVVIIVVLVGVAVVVGRRSEVKNPQPPVSTKSELERVIEEIELSRGKTPPVSGPEFDDLIDSINKSNKAMSEEDRAAAANLFDTTRIK